VTVTEVGKDLVANAAKLAALEERAKEIISVQERILAKIELVIERVTRLEANYQSLNPESLKKSTKDELMRDITPVLERLELQLESRGARVLNANLNSTIPPGTVAE
jgi:hypothetical protein